MKINACHAAVMTSSKKPLLPSWTKAPGTPVSEAWETMSGPMSRSTPLATPIRKVVLRLNTNDKCVTPLTAKLNSETPIKRVVLSKPAPSLDLDVEQKIARLENSIATGCEEATILQYLGDLKKDFGQDSVAVKEWVCNQASKHLESSLAPAGKAEIVGLISEHFSAVTDFTGYSKIVTSSMEYLSKNIGNCVQQLDGVCRSIDKLAVDDSLCLRLCGSLIELLPTTSDGSAISHVLGALAACNNECREYLLADLLSAKNHDGTWDASTLGWLIQYTILKGGSQLTELAVKNELTKVTENLFALISKTPAQGLNVLARLVRGLPRAIELPESVASLIMTKYFGQFSIMILFSNDCASADSNSRLALCDSLTVLTQALRVKNSRAGPLDISLEHFFSLNWSLRERTEISSSYASLLEIEDSRSDSALPVTCTHGQLTAKFLAQLTQSLVLAHLRLASDPTHQIRAKALRGLIGFMNVNDTLIQGEGFDLFLASKIEDSSVTIRDLALELLSKCFTTSQIIELNFVNLIKSRLFDSSTLVRKRAVRLYRELLASDLSVEQQAEIISGLLLCADDDESSISNLAKKTLKDCWIAKMLANLHERQAAVQFVALMIKVIRALGTESSKVQLFFSACSEDTALQEGIAQLAILTVDILFESLIESVESSGWEAVRFILNAIDIFVGENHGYLSSHLRLLFELTKSAEMAIVEFALKLMRIAVIGADRSALMQLTGCQQHLAMLILKGSEPVVRNAVDLLNCYSTRIEDPSGTLGALWERFFNFLKTNRNSSLTQSLISAVCRGLFSLSCLAKFTIYSAEDSSISSVIELFVDYYKSHNLTVSYYALQSIAVLFPEFPRLAFDDSISSAYIQALESDRTDIALVTLRSFMVLIGKQPANSPALSFESSMKHSEVSLTASIIQKYICSIRNVALRSHKECQLLSLKILSFALFNGLCHPHQVLPTIVALSTSPIPEILHRARDVVRSAAETHSSFLFSDYTGILRTMFDLHSHYDSYHGFYDDGSGSESLLSALYVEIRVKRAKRNDFFAIALQEFTEACKVSNDDYAGFIIEILAALPLKTAEEVAYLLCKVHDMALLASGACLEDSERSTCADANRCLMLLKLRGYIAENYSFSLEKCEKALGNDAQGKCAVSRRTGEPLDVDDCKPMTTPQRIEMSRRLLDEQQWVESGAPLKMPAHRSNDRSKPKASKKKRRKRLTISEDSAEDDEDLF